MISSKQEQWLTVSSPLTLKVSECTCTLFMHPRDLDGILCIIIFPKSGVQRSGAILKKLVFVHSLPCFVISDNTLVCCLSDGHRSVLQFAGHWTYPDEEVNTLDSSIMMALRLNKGEIP